MRFEEGDGVNADTDGNLTFKGSGDGSSDRIEFTMKFQALQEGSTRLEQGDATVTDSAGSSVACEEGYADVTIGAARSRMLRVEQVLRLMVRSIPYPVISQTA